MFYPSPADPYHKTLFLAPIINVRRGCEEAAVTRLSDINNSYNNNCKEKGLFAVVDISTWRWG
jgi:hypothetical protein